MARRKQTTTRTSGGRAQRRRELRAAEQSPQQTPRAGGASFVHAFMLPAILVLAGIVVYANSVGVPFVFDDQIHIVQRTDQIDQLWPPSQVLAGSFRPVVQYSLAINFAISRLEPASYHVMNIIIHILAGLALFGVVRRTAQCVLKTSRDRQEREAPASNAASWFAFAIALLWMVHPLQTQAVTYVIQRGESLASLFYLLTIYCAIRSHGSEHRLWWWAAAIASCGLGMGSKAIVMSAPIAVLLWDVIFTKPPLRPTIIGRMPLYGGLAASWLMMIFTGLFQGVMRTTGDAAGIGFSVKSLTPLEYLFSQPAVLLHYLKLTFWPNPLVIDYQWPVVQSLAAGVLPGLVIVAMLGLAIWGIVKRHWMGFAGAMFFLVLAPTSSFVPLKDLAFEHRMYLPLASVIAVTIGVVIWLAHRAAEKIDVSATTLRIAGVALAVIVAGAMAARSIARNQDYQSPMRLWASALEFNPENIRARINLGNAYKLQGDELRDGGDATGAQQAYAEAIRQLQSAFDAMPNEDRNRGLAALNLGGALFQSGRHAEAVAVLRPLVEREPGYVEAWFNLGQAHIRQNQNAEAAAAFGEAFRLDPNITEAGVMHGNALVNLNRVTESIAVYQRAIDAAPPSTAPRTLAMAHVNLGNSHLRQSRPDDALREYARAKQIDPSYPNIDQRIAQAQAVKRSG